MAAVTNTSSGASNNMNLLPYSSGAWASEMGLPGLPARSYGAVFFPNAPGESLSPCPRNCLHAWLGPLSSTFNAGHTAPAHLSLFLTCSLLPPDHKDPWDDINPAWIIQADFPILNPPCRANTISTGQGLGCGHLCGVGGHYSANTGGSF